ncbi:sugar transporter [Lophium mytilinum]|uniref:Sugar transporter n=1 Tax=Lophium mytilinum TaxID=390894 RepID=A0A6A6R184_9PEZI|nr:sugar transporter [Lophium mytilinum]
MDPKKRRVVLIGCYISLSGLLYGLDTGSIGPITSMTQFTASIGPLTPIHQGLYVSSFLLSAALSSLASGHVADKISRKYGILTGAFLTLAGTVFSAASPNLAALICARLLTGVGAGQAISVTTVYLVEIARPEVRGTLACLIQSYIVSGVALGYFISYGTRGIAGSLAWRAPFIIQAVVAACLCAGAGFMPFSPRWLVRSGRSEEAKRVLLRLREPLEAEQELVEIREGIDAERQRPDAGWSEMFARRYVGRTALGCFLMAFQQLTGIDAILYYAPIVFQQAGFTAERASFLASGVSGIIMVLCTVPAQIWVDKWSRRKTLGIGGMACAGCFIVIGSLYAKYGSVQDGGVVLSSKPAQWTVIVLIYVFSANFSWSWAVVGKIYACEIIPTRLRAKVCAVEQLTNWLVNFTIALTAPLFLRSSPSGPYFLFGFSTLLAATVCFFMPETAMKSLEQIEGLFEKGQNLRSSVELEVGNPPQMSTAEDMVSVVPKGGIAV